MRILLGGNSDNGGGSWWLADAINRHTDHEARALRGYQSYLQYPYDIVEPTQEQVDTLVKWADVIHIRDAFPKVSFTVGKKPIVLTYTGRVFRKQSASVYKAHRRGYVICVATADMMAFCPEVGPTWLPNPRESMAALWKPSERFSIVQAPTSRQGKQTALVVQAARQLDIPIEIVENVSYAECVKRKGRAHVTVDQLKYGYGNNAIEGWALGQPVVSGFFSDTYRDAILAQCGCIPFAEARAELESVVEVMRRLRDDVAYYREIQELGQDQFYRFHFAPIVAEKAIRVYQRALGR